MRSTEKSSQVRAYLTVAEAAREIGIHRNTLAQAIKRGDVNYVAVSGRQRLSPEEVRRLRERFVRESEGLAVSEVARILRVTPQTITEGIKRKEIPGEKRMFGAGYFIDSREFEVFSRAS